LDARLGFVADEESPGDYAPHPGSRLVVPEEWPAIARSFGLTTREREVVILLFRGRTCASIAQDLSIRTRTVRQYLEQIYNKLDIQDRIELVLRIIEVRDELRDEI
jgi:DNA-binding NarL/FixJ family response regulator